MNKFKESNLFFNFKTLHGATAVPSPHCYGSHHTTIGTLAVFTTRERYSTKLPLLFFYFNFSYKKI